MSFLDFTGLISDDQLSELASLNATRAAEGKELITLLDVMADDTILESTGVDLTSEGSEAVLNEMSAINDAAAGLAEVDRFTGADTNEIIQGLVQENIDAGGTPNVVDLIETYIDDQANATVELSGGELDLSDLADYGQGSSVVLAPDGKGVIRGGNYISLDPTQSSMSGSEVNDLKAQATRNTNLLLAQQEFEENGTPIAETLGLKQPGDKGYDGEDRERISEAEFAASQLASEQSDIVAYKAYVKSNEGPAPVPTGGVGSIQQDANGNWFAVTDRGTRDYSIDPKDNSAGPTFGGNVSENIEKTFAEEVAAAGGSSDYTGSIKDIFKDTDVDSLGYDAATGTYSTPEPVVTEPVETDIAQPGDLDIPEVTTETLDGTPVLTMEEIEKLATEAIDTAPDLTFTPTGGPGTFTPGSLPAGDPDTLDPRGDQIVSPTGTGIGTPTTPVGANDTTEALLNLTAGIGAGDVGLAEADATSKLLAGEDLTDDDITALMPPSTGVATEVTPSITPERLVELEEYVETLQRQQGIYTADDLDAAGFSASEIAAFEQGLPATGLTEAQIAENLETYGSLAEAPGTIQKYANMLEFVKGNPDLTLSEMAKGLGYSSAGGFLEELSLRAGGTGKQIDDILNSLASVGLISGSDIIDNPQYIENLKSLEDMSDLDMLALEIQAEKLGVTVESLLDPGLNDSGERITTKIATDAGYTTGSDIFGVPGIYDAATDTIVGGSGIAKYLNEQSKGLFAQQSDEYRAAVEAGMPDPNNIGYTMDGRKITDPSLWMADTAIQELGGFGIDVAALALNPLIGVPLALQQNIAEAGMAASNDVSTEMDALRNTAFADLSDADFNELKEAAKTQGFYTSGVAGGVVDTMSAALALGAPKILVKALPGVLTRVAGILGSEFVAGGAEQAGVNQAIISAMKAEGLNPEDYGVDLLNGTFNAAWSEMFGATGAAGGSVLLGNKAGNVDVGASTAGSSLPAGAGQGQDNNPNAGPDLIASQGLNTIESNDVTDSNGVVYGVDTAVDANGNTSVTVTNKTTNTSKTTNVANGNTNVVSVGSDTSVLVDSTNTNNSNTVNVSTLSPGSEVTIGGGENLLGGDDDTNDAVSAYDANTLYARNGVTYVGDPANNVVAEGAFNGVNYVNGQPVFAATGTGDAVAGGNIVNNVDVSGTGITGVIQGGGTNTGGENNTNLTLVGNSSVNTNGDVTITTVTDADGNATVSTTNNVTGENTITNVVVGDSTSVTNGNTTVDINAETNGTTTQATDNKVTTVEDGSSTTEGDSPVNTGVGVVTTVEEPDYLPGDTDVTPPPDVTIPPIDTVFVPPTEFTPGGDDDDDDEVPPVGEQTPGYTSGIAGLSGARPTVAPYYQPQQTGQYSFYVPQPGVDQTVPAGPVMSDPTSYLAPTANPQYGYGYIAPNAELEYLRRLAEIQGTGAEKLPSENLMDGS